MEKSHRKVQRVAKRFQKALKKLVKVARVREKGEAPTPLDEGDRVQRKLLKKMHIAAHVAVLLDKEHVKQKYPQLFGMYLQDCTPRPGVIAMGYDWKEAGDPGIAKELKQAGLDLEKINELRPTQGASLPKENSVMFELFPEMQEFVCFDERNREVANQLSQFEDREQVRMILKYLGYKLMGAVGGEEKG
ncbi:MAG TPA: hypothetical protein P5560_10775 [Thermotogota bacterium]|nr:hypothetical protein [Thermotogota bacterium]HRW93421.1 hypothetical protein [Thermotogota bacterium]